jgi:hypothetical protein
MPTIWFAKSRELGLLRAGRMLSFIVAILAVSPRAQAADSATERVSQAQSACLSGDCATGVAILAELYVSTRNAICVLVVLDRCGRGGGRRGHGGSAAFARLR